MQLLVVLTYVGCFPSYELQTRNYKTIFSQSDSLPDYTDLRFWAAHPWKKDPSDSVPKPLSKETRDSTVDVFFIHPTTLTDPKLEGIIWNATLFDASLNAKTDYTSILYQASVFNGSCRVFAPRYRQAHLFSFYSNDTLSARRALELAYNDVEAAFLYYLNNYNNGRPIIIAAHSQGTFHAEKILKKYFDNNTLSKKLVAAYIVGLSVPENYFQALIPCSSPNETGCINSWRTFRTGFTPAYIKDEQSKSIVTNPLSWLTNDTAVSRKKNDGSVLYNFNKRYRYTNGAKIEKNILWTNKPKFFFSFLLKTKNYHAGDYNLFYYSIRRNVQDRIESYYSGTKRSGL